MARIKRMMAFAAIGSGIVIRPTYWRAALCVARRLIPVRWWTRRPFLPIPNSEYMRFRLETQYGGIAPTPNLTDVLAYLRWVRQWDSAS